MARKRLLKAIKTSKDDPEILREVIDHYNQWTEDNEQRRTRKNGWNDVTDAYWGKLPSDWPYISKVVDPVIRTTIVEKNARLMNSKLRGRLVPREGGDVLKARLNNALLDFQWENANYGGTMLEKWAMTDQDTRLYASKFGLVLWRYEKDEKGNVVFCGNEYYPLDIRDCGMDMAADHIRNAKWFQHREWVRIEDLELVSEVDGEPLYDLSELKMKMAEGRSDRRDVAYENRVLTLKGLDDRVGMDKAFPILEKVTEYRNGRWITFSPRYKCILRDITNPYEHKKIPVVQNRYYALQGDPIGESEVEPVLPLWRAIQAVVCGFLDEMNIRLRPPLKILDGKVRIETIVMGPEAQWLVDQVDAVTEHQSSGSAMQTFQTTYGALKSAFNTAMGDLSQGVSQVDPITQGDTTATEVRQIAKQQNSRDQKNQTSLGEAIQDMMSMWLSNNRQFLFADPDKQEYILRIVGDEMFSYFKRAGLDEMEVPNEAVAMIGDIVQQQEGNVSDDDINAMMQTAEMPKFPVYENPEEEDPELLQAKPKMVVNDTLDGAEITLVPDDLSGNYDYIADTKSMAAGADVEMQQGIARAIDRLIANPTVLQLLQMQGVQPQVKELLIAELEGGGLRDAERFFTTQQPTPQVPGAGGGLQQALPVGGIPPELEATLRAGDPNSMAGSQGLPQQGQVPGGVQSSVQQSPGVQPPPQVA
jgi:hypothetical protein